MSTHDSPAQRQTLFGDYRPLPGVYDEFYAGGAVPRAALERVVEALNVLPTAEYRRRQALADATFMRSGITFAVYSDARGTDKTFPFDMVPRVLTAAEWNTVERGLMQRLEAIEHFLGDVYGEQRIVAEGKVPAHLVSGGAGFRPQVAGLTPPGGVYVVVAGIDLVRAPTGEFLVLEDNLRVPSGVSYVLENRNVLKRLLPRVFEATGVRPVDEYALRLRDAIASIAPAPGLSVVWTPGPYNSAYFEHAFLARRMGIPLVQGSDLFVRHNELFLRTTRGPERVTSIYRRIDDDFIDPHAFREDSLLGVPHLFDAYRAGSVSLANAIGNGVADSKAIYPYVPEMIRFYLAEEPILGQVPTFRCGVPAELSHVLAHLEQLVVKETDGSGGYGMLIGPTASAETRSAFAERLRAKPEGYVAQPLVELSTCPTWAENGLVPRRVDLRPYIVTGAKGRWVLPGGLTRVALIAGSYVVNSSQGGGSKDTWVLEAR